MRHRAPGNLLALLRLRRWQPRRRAARVQSQTGIPLLCAVVCALALISGGLVAANELGGASGPTSGAQDAAERAEAAVRTSRSDGRTPWPTTTGAPIEPPASERGANGGATTPRDASPGAQPRGERTPMQRDESLLTSPLGVPSPEGPAGVATSLPTPDDTTRIPPKPTGSARSRQRDTATEPAPESSTPAADSTAPQTTILSGPTLVPDSGLREDSKFAFSANESATFACSLDRRPFQPCDSPQEYRDLSPGQHEFAVRAIDAAGNVDPTPDRRSWITTGLDRQTDWATDDRVPLG